MKKRHIHCTVYVTDLFIKLWCITQTIKFSFYMVFEIYFRSLVLHLKTIFVILKKKNFKENT